MIQGIKFAICNQKITANAQHFQTHEAASHEPMAGTQIAKEDYKEDVGRECDNLWVENWTAKQQIKKNKK